MEEAKIICWDLDETLGSFRDLVSARSGNRSPHPQDVYVLRKDLIRTLNRLLDKGYRHVVVSSAKFDYSVKVLQTICLDAYFDKILGRSKPAEGIWGKRYKPAAEAFELNDSTAPSHMLVIADQASDEPVDLSVVFIHDERGLETSALDYEYVAEALWEKGEGSFKRGFEFFFETGKRMTCLDQEMNFMLVSARITENITANLGYRNSPCTQGLKVPVIYNLHAP